MVPFSDTNVDNFFAEVIVIMSWKDNNEWLNKEVPLSAICILWLITNTSFSSGIKTLKCTCIPVIIPHRVL